MMKEKNDSDYLSLSYIQLKNHNSTMLKSKSKQSSSSSSFFHFLSIILFIFLFLLSSLIFFQTKTSHIKINHRLKRQIINHNDKQHYTDMLRRILSHRTSSSVSTDCTLNMNTDGIYQRPPENSLASQIISLMELTFQNEILILKQIAKKIQNNLNQTFNSLTELTLEKFRKEFNLDLRLLVTSQIRIKEINIRLISHDNGGSYLIKYSRKNNTSTNIIDYESITDDIIQQDYILQTFTISNVRETINNDPQRNFNTNGWWLGPVFCEKNTNEAYIMAHVLPLIKGYILVSYFNISSVDINQCTNNDVPFGGTHKCINGMECVHQVGKGFTLGAYECICRGPYHNATIIIDGNDLEWNETTDKKSRLSTLNLCECNPQLCPVKYNRFLRTIIIIIQSIFIVFVAILAGIIFQRRKIKIIKYSMWILLELVLFGAALLYASVIVDSFSPHGIVCLIMPWLREIGFTIVYGTLILRIYKMLAEFQSRKAHCVQVKEKDILRILLFISISIIGYLLGWTFVNIDHSNENLSLDDYLLGHGFTLKNKRHFQTCRPRSWDYLVHMVEFIFLCVGIRFIYSTRTAPCEYHERKLITIVIICEMLFSTLLHVIKDCLWASIDPDTLFILSFIRCHCTVTCMIIFIFCTKLCFIFRPCNDEYHGRDRFRSLADGVEPADLVAKLQSNGDIEFGELNIRDMDPEEIRAELKRLYTSLHVLKTKTMRKDNPHLTKRHGQRRKNRRFSLQAFQRHGGTSSTATGGGISSIIGTGQDKHDHDPTKTPEDSTGSHNETTHIGGMSVYRTSFDDGDDGGRGRTLSDVTMPSIGQRVTFK